MKALERLEQQLDEKDTRIEELETELRELKDDEEVNWEWCRHRILKDDAEGLPVPRLEIRCEQLTDDWYNWQWNYALVYRHTLGHAVAVPMGCTTANGGNGKAPLNEERDRCNRLIQTPFREGVHIARDQEQFGIPAFAICEGVIETVRMVDGKIHHEPWTANSSAGRAAGAGVGLKPPATEK